MGEWVGAVHYFYHDEMTFRVKMIYSFREEMTFRVKMIYSFREKIILKFYFVLHYIYMR